MRRPWAMTLVALVVVAAGCAPAPAPVPPTWTPTVLGWSTVAGASVDRPLAATSAAWWAVIEQRPTYGPGASSTLLLFRRTGPDGAPAATPAQSIALPSGVAGLALSDHVLAVRYRNALAVLDIVDLYRLDAATDTWVYGASVPRGLDNNRSIVLGLTDEALVFGDSANPGTAGDGEVVVVPLTVTGSSLSAAWLSAQGLFPDADWTSSDRLGFGRVVAVRGDVLAVASGNDHVRVYRRVAGTWTSDLTLTNPSAPASDTRYGRSLAVDTTTGAARVLVGIQGGIAGIGGPLIGGRAELWERSATGTWASNTLFTPRPGNAYGGLGFGVEVALEGTTAVIGYDWQQVPGAGGVGTVDDYRLEVYRLTPAPTFEAELSALSATGGPVEAMVSVAAVGTTLRGSHVSFVAWISIAGVLHLSSVSFDRHPA